MTQQEPIHAESAAALATKKNRVAPVPSARGAATAEELAEQEGEGDPDVVGETDGDTAEQNVGEVRKQVEKMSYEEGQSKSQGDKNNDTNSDKGDESWEKIEKEEAEGVKGDGLKRKALDRNDTSFNTVEQDVATKRQKDTPSVSHQVTCFSILTHTVSKPTGDPVQPAQPPKKPQASFSSFASSASPFASLKTASPAPALQGAAPAPAHGDDTRAIAPVSVSVSAPASAPREEKKQATFGDFAKSSPFTSGKSTPSLTTPAEDEPGSSTTSTSTPAPGPAPATTTPKPQATFSSFSSSPSPFTSSASKPKPKPSPSPFPFASASAPIKGSAFGTYSNNATPFGSGAGGAAVSDEGVDVEQQGNKRASFGDILKESRGDVQVEKEGKVAMHEQDGMYIYSLSLFAGWMS